MKRSGNLGFTLIELLTVIAIIAILAAITFIAGPRLIERAKLRSLDATMLELRTQLAQYYADNGTFPPTYGYVDSEKYREWQDRDPANVPEDYNLYTLKPYLAFLGLHQTEAFYDNFSEGYDADRDGQISALEYSPIGNYLTAQDRYEFDNVTLYDGLTPDVEVGRMQREDRARRPIIYVPVNLRQFKRVREYYVETGDFLQSLFFPPNTYEAFVLISVGPAASTFGLTTRVDSPAYQNIMTADSVINPNVRLMYHLLGLRTFFLATRDLNNNNALDFHFDARRTGEASVGEYEVSGTDFTANNNLPDPIAPIGYGPYIFVYQ
jgi:prepilin-type N-terminal cleavage/methylation domain-containing protein